MKPVYYDFAEPMLKEAGIREYNIQGYVGHGTGVKIFETPVLWKLNPTVLKPGMVIDSGNCGAASSGAAAALHCSPASVACIQRLHFY